MPDLDLNAAVEQAKKEILKDIADGTVPATVREFRQLHDYVDANWYGGLFELEATADETVDFGNDLQNRLNAWLLAGRPTEGSAPVIAQVQIPGTVVAHYKDGVISEIVFWPSASNAGYFGPAALLDEGDETLDIEETDGPFWTAMQTYIAGSDEPVISWRE